MPNWLRDERIQSLFPDFRFFLHFYGSSGTHGYRMGVYENCKGFTMSRQGPSAWSVSDDLHIDFCWKSQRGNEEKGRVPICFLRPTPPTASGERTSRTAVIITGEAMGTVVKVRRHSKKGKFTAEYTRPAGEGSASAPARAKAFVVDRDDVCRVESHDSQYEI